MGYYPHLTVTFFIPSPPLVLSFGWMREQIDHFWMVSYEVVYDSWIISDNRVPCDWDLDSQVLSSFIPLIWILSGKVILEYPYEGERGNVPHLVY